MTADTYTNMPNDERILSWQLSIKEQKKILDYGLYNPQAQNRYSYCLNNPLTLIDPDGNHTESVTKTTNEDGSYQYTREVRNDEGVLESVYVYYYSADNGFLGYTSSVPSVTGDGKPCTITSFYNEKGRKTGEIRSDPNGKQGALTTAAWWAAKKAGMFAIRYAIVHGTDLAGLNIFGRTLGAIPLIGKFFTSTAAGPLFVISQIFSPIGTVE